MNAADVNLDSSDLKDAVVDCSTTWDGSEFQSPTVRTAKEWRNACVEEPTARNLNRCFALVLSSAANRPTFSGWWLWRWRDKKAWDHFGKGDRD